MYDLYMYKCTHMYIQTRTYVYIYIYIYKMVVHFKHTSVQCTTHYVSCRALHAQEGEGMA
jgi:hypothetical protein